jgi:hypothetical protein
VTPAVVPAYSYLVILAYPPLTLPCSPTQSSPSHQTNTPVACSTQSRLSLVRQSRLLPAAAAMKKPARLTPGTILTCLYSPRTILTSTEWNEYYRNKYIKPHVTYHDRYETMAEARDHAIQQMESRCLTWPSFFDMKKKKAQQKLCFSLVSEAQKEGAFKVKDDETEENVAERQPSPLGPHEFNSLLGTSRSRQKLTVRAPSHAELAEIVNPYPPPKGSRLNDKAASTASSALQSRDKARLPTTVDEEDDDDDDDKDDLQHKRSRLGSSSRTSKVHFSTTIDEEDDEDDDDEDEDDPSYKRSSSSALSSRGSKARSSTTVDEEDKDDDEDEDNPLYRRSSSSALSSRSSKARLPTTTTGGRVNPTASETVPHLLPKPGSKPCRIDAMLSLLRPLILSCATKGHTSPGFNWGANQLP